MEKNQTKFVGVSTSGLLLILFIALKLCHVIEWSWLWVLSPMWIPVAISFIIIFIMGIVITFADYKSNKPVKKVCKNNRR